MRAAIFILPALVAIAAYCLYEPVPSYVEDRQALHLRSALVKLASWIDFASRLFGVSVRARLRRGIDAMLAHPLANTSLVTVADRQIGVHRLLVFRPTRAQPQGPALIWLHGGEWEAGSPESYANFTAALAERTGFVVLACRYRLSPEHRFPAAFDDSLSCVRAVLANATVVDVNAHRVAVGGDGVGGQLAAAVVQHLRLRHAGERQPKLQLLVHPIVQFANHRTASLLGNPRGPLLNARSFAESQAMHLAGSYGAWRHFADNRHASKMVKEAYERAVGERLDSVGTDAALAVRLQPLLLDPRASPLLAKRIDELRLPPALVVACAADPLLSDSVAYSRRLEQAGVRVYLKQLRCYHGCLALPLDALRVVDEVAGFFNSNAML